MCFTSSNCSHKDGRTAGLAKRTLAAQGLRWCVAHPHLGSQLSIALTPTCPPAESMLKDPGASMSPAEYIEVRHVAEQFAYCLLPPADSRPSATAIRPCSPSIRADTPAGHARWTASTLSAKETTCRNRRCAACYASRVRTISPNEPAPALLPAACCRIGLSLQVCSKCTHL